MRFLVPRALPWAVRSQPFGLKTILHPEGVTAHSPGHRPGSRTAGQRPGKYATVLLLLALAGCAPKSEPTSAKAEVQPVVVTVGAVKPVGLRRTVPVNGTLHAFDDVHLAPKVDGRVLHIFKNEGDVAFPGEALLELDPTDYRLAVEQARPAMEAELRKLKLGTLPESEAEFARHLPSVDAVAQARANFELAEKEAARIEEEIKRGVGSVQVLDTARTKVKVSRTTVDLAETEARVTLAHARRLEAVLHDAEERLRETRLLAPVPDGGAAWSAVLGNAANPVRYSVAAKMVAKGAMVSPMRVVNAYRLVLDHVLKLRVPVPEKFMPEVQVGQTVEVRVEAYPNRVFLARVARKFPTVDTVNRTFLTEIEVPNYARMLNTGGFARADIVTRTDDAVLTVPPEAIVTFAGVTKVFVLDGTTARAVEVEVGTREKEWVEVRGELSAGAKVITTGQTQLVDGSPVRVR